MGNKNIRWITWSINTWKSYFCNAIKLLAIKQKIDVLYISCDDIRRDILYYSSHKNDSIIRQKLIEKLWDRILWAKDTIDPILLWNTIFYQNQDMRIYEQIMIPRIRQKLQDLIIKANDNTLILIERAALLENNLQDIVSNRIIILYCDATIQKNRFHTIDIPYDQLQKRIQYFWTIEKKKEHCKDYKHCIFVDTSQWLSDKKNSDILYYMVQNA